jgi:hypothetical protein
VHAHSEAAGSGGNVVAGKSALAALIQFAVCGQGERMCGNYGSALQNIAKFRV